MTAHPNPAANDPHEATDRRADASHSHDDAPLVAADVPIAVWRLDEHDDDQPADDPDPRLAARLVRRLVLVYSRVGDVVVDLDDDPLTRATVTDLSRRYLSIAGPGYAKQVATLTAPVGLVILRWHRDTAVARTSTVTEAFAGCRRFMTAETSAVAVLGSIDTGTASASYAKRVADLLPAAQAAGLSQVLLVVVVAGTGRGDEYLYYATRAEADSVRRGATTRPERRSKHFDLLIFARRHP